MEAPADLAGALDYLDTSWRLAFSEELMQLRTASGVAALELRCLTREDFKSWISSLDDVLKAFNVADALLPAGATIPANQTFNRVEAVLRDRLQAEAFDEIKPSLDVLRAANRVRVGYQHSDAHSGLPDAFARFGVAMPAEDWESTWTAVRNRTAAALRRLAEAVRGIAVDS